jgi:hypothetical protein
MADQTPGRARRIIASIRHRHETRPVAVRQFNDKTNTSAVIPFGNVDFSNLVA